MNTKRKFKIVLMGASDAGKTSLVTRFSRGTFGADQESTIGAAFISRDVATSKGTITLHIWDTAGQERYRSLVPKYSQGSKAIIIVFDVSDPESYESAKGWYNEAVEMHADKVKYYLVANKIDIQNKVDLSKVKEYAQEKRIQYFATSAKTGENVSNLFDSVAFDLIEMLSETHEDSESMSLKEKNDGGCC